MTKTVNIPADLLTVGTKFIPAGKKRPVTVHAIFDRAATIEVVATSPYGNTAHIISRYATIETVKPTFA